MDDYEQRITRHSLEMLSRALEEYDHVLLETGAIKTGTYYQKLIRDDLVNGIANLEGLL